MEDRNARYRQLHLQHVPSTGGIPGFYLSTVRMFRAAFPEGFTIDSGDYNAVCMFLDHEGYPFRAIAQVLDFSFGLGYVSVLNTLGFIEDPELKEVEIKRIEQKLAAYGLDEWRLEDK